MQDREFSAILEEDPLQPLALVPLTEEEQVRGLGVGRPGGRNSLAPLSLIPFSFGLLQRNFSMSVNSVAVLRLMGKGAGVAPAGVSRGRGSTRSRGKETLGEGAADPEGVGSQLPFRQGQRAAAVTPLLFPPSPKQAGRGRGESGFYQRSIEETDGGAFGRGGLREIHRSQSWDDRCVVGGTGG